MTIARSALPAALLALLGTACSVSQPKVPLSKFLAGDYEPVRAFAAEQAVDGDEENVAIVLNVQGQCDRLLGKPDDARRAFQAAAQMMGNWSTSGSEATAAILGSESSKTWKGDPFEKAMNAFYLAFTYLLKGEPDNARAACKRGILADAEVADEKYQADNALLFWMAGRMSRLMGSGDAADFFKEANAADAFAQQHGSRGDALVPVLREPNHGNLVLLFECGLGPEKYAAGRHDELARFRGRLHPAVRAQATVDGRPVGTAAILLDVDYQARTLGGTEMEGIREGKAVFKTASLVSGVVLLDQAARARGNAQTAMAIAGGAALLLGVLTSASADVRYWPTLPSTVQALALDVPPGSHDVVVEFLDGSGRVLPSLSQRTTAVVPAQGEAWFLFRSLPAPRAPAP